MTNNKMKVPPHSVDTEKQVLGAILLGGNSAFATVAEYLTSESFYEPKHKTIYTAITNIDSRGDGIDVITLVNELTRIGVPQEKIGIQYLAELSNYTSTTGYIVSHAKIVQDKYIQRQTIQICETLLSEAYKDTSDVYDAITTAQSQIYGLANNIHKNKSVSIADIWKENNKTITKMQQNDGAIIGIPTGLSLLDHTLLGLQKGNYYLIGGRPGTGKTALALTIAYNAAKAGHSTTVLSLEMSATSLGLRALAGVINENSRNIRRGKVDLEKIVNAILKNKNVPLYIDDDPYLSVKNLRQRVINEIETHKTELLIVDYIQLMTGTKVSRVEEVSEISRSLNALKKEFNIPVIGLAQLNRALEISKDKRPKLSDLKESGQLEQDADVVMFTYRDCLYNDDAPKDSAEIIIRKNRDGDGNVSVPVRFIAEQARFADENDNTFRVYHTEDVF